MQLKHGISLIETLLVLALMGVVGAFGIGLSYTTLSRSELFEQRDLLATELLPTLRMKALANKDALHHGIRITNDSFILFEGTTSAASSTSNRVLERNPGVTITPLEEIVFEPLSGNIVSGTGTLTLSTESATTSIHLGAGGRIDW